MWLLDANMDVHLTGVLTQFGIVSHTAADRGWKALSKGQLVAAAVASGFDCLLTRDRLLGESASHALRVHSMFALILINLPRAGRHRCVRLVDVCLVQEIERVCPDLPIQTFGDLGVLNKRNIQIGQRHLATSEQMWKPAA